MNLSWFNDNYIENIKQIKFLLEQAEIKYSFSKEQLYEGCKQLRLKRHDKDLLDTHIRLLGNMVDAGINARIAGIKLREAFLDTDVIVPKGTLVCNECKGTNFEKAGNFTICKDCWGD